MNREIKHWKTEINNDSLVAENYKSSKYHTTALIRILKKNLSIQPNQIGNNAHLFYYNKTGKNVNLTYLASLHALISTYQRKENTKT